MSPLVKHEKLLLPFLPFLLRQVSIRSVTVKDVGVLIFAGRKRHVRDRASLNLSLPFLQFLLLKGPDRSVTVKDVGVLIFAGRKATCSRQGSDRSVTVDDVGVVMFADRQGYMFAIGQAEIYRSRFSSFSCVKSVIAV
jgi:hypothetical protein